MLKFKDVKVVFREIPDEITLAIGISGCPVRCPDCHSKYLWEDIGSELTITKLDHLITENTGVTCILFSGGDADVNYLNNLAKYIKTKYNINVAWYSGKDYLPPEIELEYWDYIKLGPFIKERGGLGNPNTNQKLFKIHKLNNKWEIVNITSKLW